MRSANRPGSSKSSRSTLAISAALSAPRTSGLANSSRGFGLNPSVNLAR